MHRPSSPSSSPDDIVDAYLADRFKIGLEQVIVDASRGVMSAALTGTVEITCRINGRFRYEDRGEALHCDGSITVEGVTYRYRTWIFEDLDGARYMTDLSEFAMEDWKVNLRRGHAG